MKPPATSQTPGEIILLAQSVDRGGQLQKNTHCYKKAKQIMAKGGFNLRKWKTNSQDLQRTTYKAESVTNSSFPDGNRANKELVTESKTQIHDFKNTATNKVFVKVLRMITQNGHTKRLNYFHSIQVK